jgi:hypothetical protein
MTWTIIPTVILCAAPWVILLMWWRDVRLLRRSCNEWREAYARLYAAFLVALGEQQKSDKQEGQKT